MGLSFSSACFFVGEARRGVDFSSTLLLGRQNIYMRRKQYKKICSFLNIRPDPQSSLADSFYFGLGAKCLNFLDASAYEGADLIYDLNLPIPASMDEKWSCVIDGGTLEHVFNFPEAIKNAMRLVKKGGHLLLATPWTGFAGHGFYQFSPELFFRVLSEENGFEIERMLMFYRGRWFSIKDPNILGTRVEIFSAKHVELFISAKRKSLSPIFLQPPQQSDYSQAWSLEKADLNTSAAYSYRAVNNLKAWIFEKIYLFEFLREVWRERKCRRANSVRRASWAKKLQQNDSIPV